MYYREPLDVSSEQNDEDKQNVRIPEQNSTLHFLSLKDSKCLSMLKQTAFMERQGGFCLQVVEALVNEQETCQTGVVLLCLSERINLCLPPHTGLPQPSSSLRALAATASSP